MSSTTAVNTPFVVGEVASYRGPFLAQLQRENLSKNTIEKYDTIARMFIAHLVAKGMPTVVAAITSEHVEDFFDAVRARSKPNTLVTYRIGLHRFFEYLRNQEGEITTNPVPKVKVIVPEESVAILRPEQVRAMLDVCQAPSVCEPRVRFEAARDYALILTLIDTGGRVSEITGLSLSDVDFTLRQMRLFGKGRRERTINLSDAAAKAIRRYLRLRSERPDSLDTDRLWLGLRGPLTRWGVRQILRRRAGQARLGFEPHPHQFRHTFAHEWLARGGSETNLMAHNGWRSRTMLSRYAKSAAEERARAEHRELAPGDRYAD